jgi:hypothetical protein
MTVDTGIDGGTVTSTTTASDGEFMEKYNAVLDERTMLADKLEQVMGALQQASAARDGIAQALHETETEFNQVKIQASEDNFQVQESKKALEDVEERYEKALNTMSQKLMETTHELKETTATLDGTSSTLEATEKEVAQLKEAAHIASNDRSKLQMKLDKANESIRLSTGLATCNPCADALINEFVILTISAKQHTIHFVNNTIFPILIKIKGQTLELATTCHNIILIKVNQLWEAVTPHYEEHLQVHVEKVIQLYFIHLAPIVVPLWGSVVNKVHYFAYFTHSRVIVPATRRFFSYFEQVVRKASSLPIISAIFSSRAEMEALVWAVLGCITLNVFFFLFSTRKKTNPKKGAKYAY